MRLVLLLLVLAHPALARVRAVHSRLDAARRILVVTAHPDDEILIAPFLAQRCVRGGASCAFVVLTNGDHPVRSGEMARAAAMFNARLTNWSYPDVMGGFDAAWAGAAQRLADEIALERPDMILTFDPAHGTTGHPAHREVGRLVLETGARNIFQIETAAQFIGSGFELSNAAGDRAWVVVANGDWEYVVRDAENHASQFSPAQVESLRTLPADQRKVWLIPVP